MMLERKKKEKSAKSRSRKAPKTAKITVLWRLLTDKVMSLNYVNIFRMIRT
jgi:hypothetical protein